MARSRWRAAWKVRRHARGHRLNFDLHRATGLWLWPLLLAFAWSSVGLLLPSVERPVIRVFGASDDYAPRSLRHPLDHPAVGMQRAVVLGVRSLEAIGTRQGFGLLSPEGISYDPATGSYRLGARTTLDPGRAADTAIWMDAQTGRTLRFERPFGRGAADAVRRLFLLLHFADILGLPYRIFVSVLGLAVTILSVTGVLIWTRKRSARLASAAVRQERLMRQRLHVA